MDDGVFWMLWLVIGGACAAACWVLASRKGRSPLGYAVLGFVLPLIGVIVAAVVSPRDAAPAA